MSESTIFMIKKELGEEKAEEFIREMSRNPHKEAIERALSIFGSLKYHVAEEILQKYAYSVESAFDELEQINTLAEEEEQRRRQLEERRRKEQENSDYIETFMKHFKNLSKEEITRVFNENQKDPKRTSQALVSLIQQKERENEESQRLRRELEIKNLVGIYGGIYAELQEGYIEGVVRENGLDPEKITTVLDRANKQKMFEDLYLQFAERLTAQEIQQVLRIASWKKLDAARMCLEKVKLAEELERKLREQREREEQERREQEQREREQREKELQEKELQELRERERREQEEREQREREEREQREREEQERREKEKEEVPALELDENDLKEIEHQSKFFTIPFIKENLTREQEIKEKETLQMIESTLIESIDDSQPQASPSTLEQEPTQEGGDEISDSQELSHSITVTEAEGKLHAKAKVIGENSYSWIGFYKKGEADNKYITYNYVSKLPEKTLVVDRPALNGEYEFRAFLSKYQIACKSEPVSVANDDKVELELDENAKTSIKVNWRVGSFDPYQSRAYVTIHKAEETRPNYYRRWSWMETPKGSYTHKKPIHSGVYEARVYIGNELKFRSESVEIQGI